MKERIKRVDKGYWLIVFLWLTTLPGTHETLLAIVAGVVIVSYLIWKMAGDEA